MNDMITIDQPANADASSEPGTALAIIPAASLPTLIAADKTDILGKLRAELAGYTPDASTEPGRKEIGQKVRRIGVAKMDFKRLKEGLLEDAKKQVASVNAEYKVIEMNCDALRDTIDGVLEAYKQIERDRVAGHEAALARLTVDPEMERATSEELAEAIRARQEQEARNWQEFHERAIKAHADAIAVLSRWRSNALDREAEAAELARLRAEEAERVRVAAIEAQRLREERIAAEAAEAARVEAEAKAQREAEAARLAAERAAQAERDAIAKTQREAAAAFEAFQRKAEAEKREAAEALERERAAVLAAAERERIAADRAEREKAEAVDAERRRLEAIRVRDEALAQRKALEEKAAAEKRAANVAHQRKINGEVLVDMVAAMEAVSPTGGDLNDFAKAIIVALAKNQIRHTNISY